jgi:hypothetical protein
MFHGCCYFASSHTTYLCYSVCWTPPHIHLMWSTTQLHGTSTLRPGQPEAQEAQAGSGRHQAGAHQGEEHAAAVEG